MRLLHWLPSAILLVFLLIFIALGKPLDEWYLVLKIAPFTIGTPVLSLLLFKLWYSPRFLPSGEGGEGS